MTLFDMFTGIGGFSLAFMRAYPEGKIVGYSEIDKYAIEIYQKHFPGVINFGDIRSIRAEDLPHFNVGTFGFPCQDHSVAGRRQGLAGERSGLFYQAIRIIDKMRPEYFIFENVKGLFSSNQRQDFIEVLQAITDIGYNGQWQLINTKWFLPQNRERIYFVGHLREIPRPQIFPVGESITEDLNAEICETENICSAIDANYYKGLDNKGQRTMIQVGTLGKDSEATRVYDPEGIARTIKYGGGMGAKTGLYAFKALTEARTDESREIRSKEKKDIRRGKKLVPRADELGNCVTAGQSREHLLTDGVQIRRLTPLECERLQGFPDNWTEGISDTQRYKCLGNSISEPIAEIIFRKLRGQNGRLIHYGKTPYH